MTSFSVIIVNHRHVRKRSGSRRTLKAVVDVAKHNRVEVGLYSRLVANILPDKGRAVSLAAIRAHFVEACESVRATSNKRNLHAPTLIVRIALESFFTSMRLFSDWSSTGSVNEPSSLNVERSPI
jgi:hypothetical protein